GGAASRAPADRFDLSGMRSLPIALEYDGQAMTFQSLGGPLALHLKWRHATRSRWLAAAAGLLAFAAGWWYGRRQRGTRAAIVLAMLLLPSMVGLIVPSPRLGAVSDAIFFAGLALLAAFGLLALGRKLRTRRDTRTGLPAMSGSAATTASVGLALTLLLGAVGSA